MTCRKVVPLIDDFADGLLNKGIGVKTQKHISSCAKCQITLEKTHRLKTLLSGLAIPNPGAPYFHKVSELILARVTAETEIQRRVH